MATRPKIPFLTDVNVPDSVGDYLRGRKHSVVRVRSIMPITSPDPVVAEAALRAGKVLVSWDKDFNQQRFLKPRFAGLSRIAFSCPEPMAVQRLKALMSLIESEWELARKAGHRMVIHVGSDQLRIRR
jgi:hypothetical protein